MPINGDDPVAPFLPGAYAVRIAASAWERAGHFALRRAVFCDEQRVFAANDRDAVDEHATPIVATTCVLGAPDTVVGAVRIHTGDPGDAAGVWRGSRLAVHPDHRRVGRLGAELIRLAVSTAHGRGARRFLAHVQLANVALFRRLHWRSLDAVELHGLPHHLMEADLAAYPPTGRDGWHLVRPVAATARRAA